MHTKISCGLIYIFIATASSLPISPEMHEIYIQVSPPRCMSTATTRMWASYGGFTVLNEPYISAFVFHNETDRVLTSHWWRADAPQTFEEVTQKILQMAENGPVFVKEESFALVDYLRADLSIIFNPHVHFIFLIRNPHHAICSYYKGHKKIIDDFSYLAGFQPSYEIFQMVQQYGNNNPIILCAEDLYNQPYETAQDLCKALDIPFFEHMLQWQDLGDSFTGINEWGELKKPELTHYWHGAAIHSTEFHKPTSYEVDAHGNPTFSEVTDDGDRLVCLQAYHENKVFYDLLIEAKASQGKK